MFLALLIALLGADSPQQAFLRMWEHQTVVVKRALFTLVYDERGKMGNTYADRKDGLVVVTQTGVFYQFEGRQGREDVVKRRPEEIMDAVHAAYLPDSLEVRSYQKVTPTVIYRYDPGVELVIRSVRIDRQSVRVGFALPAKPDEEVTTLTVWWPAPFTKAFTEHDIVEALIRGFVDPKPLS